ncbi:unnamed protein product [Diabrotica balteata]|uniref:Uncharacterized protein n=1 Tax=Diabrotica balteata TaxID=107213 RepID=A0A9N9XBT4_DIABA|nr:unnamed protein product [Diabrotica balteata]
MTSSRIFLVIEKDLYTNFRQAAHLAENCSTNKQSQTSQTQNAALTCSTDPIDNEYIPLTQKIFSSTSIPSTKPDKHILPSTHVGESTDF